jgi:hypothetical protein
MPIVRLPKGELRDEIRLPVMDTWELMGGVSPVGGYTFFQNIAGKSLNLTNMTTQGSFPTATSFRLQGIQLDAQNEVPLNSRVIPLVVERSSMRIKIGEKEYWYGPCRFLAGRMFNSYATGNASDFIFQQSGMAAVQAVLLQGRHSVDINPLQRFAGVLELLNSDVTAAEITAMTPQATTRVNFVLSFKGLLRRPVQ